MKLSPYWPLALGLGLSTQAQAALDITHYDLTLEVEPSTLLVDASARLTVLAPAGGGPLTQIELDLVGLTVEEVSWEGEPATFTRSSGKLVVNLASPLPEGRSGVVAITYGGVPDAYVTEQGDLGLMQDRDITFAINVTDGARYWFPCNDRLDDKATVDLGLIVPRGDVSAGPGHLASVTPLDARTELHQWTMGQEITPYLLAFAFSNSYVAVPVEVDAGEYPGEVLLLPASLDTAQVALETLPTLVDWLQERYGSFPFDRVALHEIPFPGAVEQPGNIAMGSFYFAEDPRLLMYFAHELSHSWFQGKVTIRNWDQIWLSEGAAAWHELLWVEESEGVEAADAQAAVYIDAYRVGMPSEGVFPISDPEVVFGYTTYMKGPTVWRLLEHLAGRQELLGVIHQYLNDGDGVGDLDDFFTLLEQLPGLGYFREEWIDRAGLPSYEFGWAAGPSADQIGVALQLKQDRNLWYHTDVDVTLRFDDGSEQAVLLSPDSADYVKTVCTTRAPVEVVFDPRRMIPAAPADSLAVVTADPAMACDDGGEPTGCGARYPGGGFTSLLGLVGVWLPLRRRQRKVRD